MASHGPPSPDAELPIDPDLDGGDSFAGRPGSRGRRADASVLSAMAIGGGLGATARYGVAQLMPVRPGAFPWATWLTNVSGSLALGFILAVVLERFPPTRYVRPFMATGFLGAYTTYSTFAVETDVLMKDGHLAVALIYVIASLSAGFLAAWTGLWGGRNVPLASRSGARR